MISSNTTSIVTAMMANRSNDVASYTSLVGVIIAVALGTAFSSWMIYLLWKDHKAHASEDDNA